MDSLQSIPVKITFAQRVRDIPAIFGIRPEPKYNVILRDGVKEIRECHPMLIAQTQVKGSYEEASQEAFYRLAGYFFGRNNAGEKIHMMAPIFQARAGRKCDQWMMSFILPPKFKMSSAPWPLSDSIKVMRIPSICVAVLKYSGKNSEALFDERGDELLNWLEKEHTSYKAVSDIRVAQYDAPFALPFFRRNEIQITIQSFKH